MTAATHSICCITDARAAGLQARPALVRRDLTAVPPDLEFRVTLAFNLNYAQVPERTVLSINPSNYPNRFDDFLGVQEAFVDYHIRNVSERYDFDSVRVGIQPFSTDFRGFLFQDDNLGVRVCTRAGAFRSDSEDMLARHY